MYTHHLTRLSSHYRPAILAHFKRLSSDDRRLRFFCTLTDHALEHFVENVLEFDDTVVFGLMQGTKLVGMASLTIISNVGAEAAFSVDEDWRGTGLAHDLLRATIEEARVRKVSKLCMSCLRANKKMQALARSFGLNIKMDFEEAYAELQLLDTSVTA